MKTVSKTRFHLWWILVVVGALLAMWLFSGCENLGERAKQSIANYDRTYSGTYDLSTGRATAMVTISRAAKPGAGRPSFGIGLSSDAPAVDFKRIVKPSR